MGLKKNGCLASWLLIHVAHMIEKVVQSVGVIFCCEDNLQCKLRNGFRGLTRKLSLRYKIRWVDWDEHQVPLKFYILDSTDRVTLNGSTLIHDCQVHDLFNIYYTLHMKRKPLKLNFVPNKNIRMFITLLC